MAGPMLANSVYLGKCAAEILDKTKNKQKNTTCPQPDAESPELVNRISMFRIDYFHLK